MVREFEDLHQMTETVAEITTKFGERSLLVLKYAVEEEKKKVRYHDMIIEPKNGVRARVLDLL